MVIRLPCIGSKSLRKSVPKLILVPQTSKNTISIPKASNLAPKDFQLELNMAPFGGALGVPGVARVPYSPSPVALTPCSPIAL